MELSTSVPASVREIAFGWDPAEEVERLLFLCRESEWFPNSALELGCGTGRLLPALKSRVAEVQGLELDRQVAEFAAARTGLPVHAGDMARFSLPGRFDLIFTSANTIRHLCSGADIASFWSCVADHLVPGGIFIADLEIGFELEQGNVGKPARWMLSRGDALVHASWTVLQPPDPVSRCSLVEWSFELREPGASPRRFAESFPLRVYDGPEFARLATAERRMALLGFYELRPPYLLERAAENARGRMLAAFRHWNATGPA